MPNQIIKIQQKDPKIIDDQWQLLKLNAEQVEEGMSIESLEVQENSIVPLDLANKSSKAIWLDSHQEIKSITQGLEQFEVIAINFPIFTDGRGYSLALKLRSQYDYKGEIRAIGNVLIDQLFYMQRSGFDCFALEDPSRNEEALAYFDTFKEVYQTSTDNKQSILMQRIEASA